MDVPTVNVQQKRGVEDSGPYFRYMAEFVGLTAKDAEMIRQTKPAIEKNLSEIVAKFYTHLLRYPPTRQWFLREDGTVDQDYLELRMRHLTNFWLRTADALFDDDYARYVDYVGRAHTSHGADPRIYIAERYVIGQVGFLQHAITEILVKELYIIDEVLTIRAEEAWSKFMMVLLEMLSRAYNPERTIDKADDLLAVDREQVERLAAEAFEIEHRDGKPVIYKRVTIVGAAEIPDGERKIVKIDGLSIGVFHHKGKWYALRNSCLHRGGPVCTGTLQDDTLTCPWHGFQYDVTNGRLLVDPNTHLDTYPIFIEGDQVVLQVPDLSIQLAGAASPAASITPEEMKVMQSNEFKISDVPSGTMKCVEMDDQTIAVYNVGGEFYATQNECTHAEGPLCEGTLEGAIIECPWHGSKFDVRTGAVVARPAKDPVRIYRVVVEGGIGRVEPD
jgi:nitrite reductase/ring-hydroxylating ferredoxin subunit/hemoglobin-like flavoprotein